MEYPRASHGLNPALLPCNYVFSSSIKKTEMNKKDLFRPNNHFTFELLQIRTVALLLKEL